MYLLAYALALSYPPFLVLLLYTSFFTPSISNCTSFADTGSGF